MGLIEKKRKTGLIADYDEKAVKDFDPENEVPDESENSDSDESVDERAGTEHYVSVGKSKLRQKEAVALGPEYRGSRVSRSALDQSSDEEEEDDDDDDDEEESGEEEFADLETADLEADHVDDDTEISSDDALGDSDNEKLKDFVFRGSSKPIKPLSKKLASRPKAADFMQVDEDEDEESDEDISGSEEEDDSEEDSELEREGAMLFDDEAEETDDDEGDDDDEDEEDDEEEEGEDDDDEDEDEDEQDDNKSGDADNARAELRKAMSEGQKTIVDTISQANKQDAEKGVAVRTQRRTFDSILNLRIRLQRALVATNSFNAVDKVTDANSEPYQAAEEAAVKLWNTIDSVRHTFLPPTKSKAGEKRKHSAITLETPTHEIWETMQRLESVALAHRRKVLDKWSSRVRTTTTVKTRRLGDSSTQSLVSVLEDQLLSTDRLVKRARTPRSCAPAQVALKVEEDKDIYDDADFYQLLLKELVDQRSMDASAPGGEHVATVRWAALKEAKTRKQVDRKASKGRKLRYTVHEKLQNFMAPEDRRSWEEHAIDRFFGALFGQKMELKEEGGDVEGEDEEMGGVEVDVEEEGLRLFRS